jgi:hypothetical protein
MSARESEKSNGQDEQPDGEKPGQREPATPDEEKAVEKEELESFRRRKLWFEEVLGEASDAARDEEKGEETLDER